MEEFKLNEKHHTELNNGVCPFLCRKTIITSYKSYKTE